MEAVQRGSRILRRAVDTQRRSRGSTHGTLNWHNLDYYTENYHSLQASASVHLKEAKHYYNVHPAHRWDEPLSSQLYAGAFPAHRMENTLMTMPYWINEHLFARTYWNTNINLYYWSHFHLNFYYIERRRRLFKSVFTNQFVKTPRWAYNLVLLYTKHPHWDFVDIGLRTKTMLYLNSHIWLVFKFKMHKIARLNGIERGLSTATHDPTEEVVNPLKNKLHNQMLSSKNMNHYQMSKTPLDHRQEGAGAAHERNYAHVGTLTGPEFSREHTVSRPWWWHSHPSKRRRWEGSNPFGHDGKHESQDPVAGMGQVGYGSTASMNRAKMSSW